MLIAKKEDILVLGEGPTDELDNAIIMAEAKYSINVTECRKKTFLSLQYNAVNSFLYAKGIIH